MKPITDVLACILGAVAFLSGSVGLSGAMARNLWHANPDRPLELIIFWHTYGAPAWSLATILCGVIALYIIARPFLYGDWS